MRRLFRDFFANRALFFDLFDQAAKNMADMAGLLVTAVNTEQADERERLFKQIDRLENTGDDVTHKINLWLDKIIFTPLNKSDIHLLASAIDDVADGIKEASGRMYLYNITDFVNPVREMASIIKEASLELQRSVNILRSVKSSEDIIALCATIKKYEQQAGQVYYHAIAELFLNDKDPIHLIKYREILFSLEATVNKCKACADDLRAIVINRG
jgi:predicted phosphate transport protein (TIGR00153 family)